MNLWHIHILISVTPIVLELYLTSLSRLPVCGNVSTLEGFTECDLLYISLYMPTQIASPNSYCSVCQLVFRLQVAQMIPSIALCIVNCSCMRFMLEYSCPPLLL